MSIIINIINNTINHFYNELFNVSFSNIQNKFKFLKGYFTQVIYSDEQISSRILWTCLRSTVFGFWSSEGSFVKKSSIKQQVERIHTLFLRRQSVHVLLADSVLFFLLWMLLVRKFSKNPWWQEISYTWYLSGFLSALFVTVISQTRPDN